MKSLSIFTAILCTAALISGCTSGNDSNSTPSTGAATAAAQKSASQTSIAVSGQHATSVVASSSSTEVNSVSIGEQTRTAQTSTQLTPPSKPTSVAGKTFASWPQGLRVPSQTQVSETQTSTSNGRATFVPNNPEVFVKEITEQLNQLGIITTAQVDERTICEGGGWYFVLDINPNDTVEIYWSL